VKKYTKKKKLNYNSKDVFVLEDRKLNYNSKDVFVLEDRNF